MGNELKTSRMLPKMQQHFFFVYLFITISHFFILLFHFFFFFLFYFIFYLFFVFFFNFFFSTISIEATFPINLQCIKVSPPHLFLTNSQNNSKAHLIPKVGCIMVFQVTRLVMSYKIIKKGVNKAQKGKQVE